MTRLPSRLLAIGVVGLLLAGCLTKAQRWYRRAEAFFSQNEYQLAVTEYYRIVTQTPNDPLADDAMYKIAYICREEFRDLPRAVAWYKQLAEQYPASSYADDALLWVLDIQARRMQDLEAARKTVQEIQQRFAGNVSVCGRAELQLARLLTRKHLDDEALQICKRIVEQRGSNQDIAASAALMIARIAEDRGDKPQRVVAQYEEVIKRYPDTVAAVEAKQAIGWIVYGQRSREEQRQRIEQERRAKVIEAVPPFADKQAPAIRQLLGALCSLLRQAGTDIAEPDVWGISGAAFQFVLDPDRPQATSRICQQNPLTTVAEALGFTYLIWAQGVDSNALVTIEQSLHNDRPSLILYGGASPQWSLVVGYKPADKQVFVLGPGAEAPTAVQEERFIQQWQAAAAGKEWLPATQKGFQFVLGKRDHTPDAAAVVRQSLARAVALSRQKAVNGVPCGQAAYEAFLGLVRKASTADGEQQRAWLKKWAQGPLQSHIFARKQASQYLRQIDGLIGGNQAAVTEEVARRYELIARQWEEIAKKLQAAVEAETPAESTWAELQILCQHVCDDELAATSKLAQAVSG